MSATTGTELAEASSIRPRVAASSAPQLTATEGDGHVVPVGDDEVASGDVPDSQIV